MKAADIATLTKMLETVGDAAAFDIRLNHAGCRVRLKRDRAAVRSDAEITAKASGVLSWTNDDFPLPSVGAEVGARQILGFIEIDGARVALRASGPAIVAARLAHDGALVSLGEALLRLRPLARRTGA